MTIVAVEPSERAVVEEFYAVFAAAHEHDRTGPYPRIARFAIGFEDQWDDETVAAHVFVRGGAVAGGYALRLPHKDNSHMAMLRTLVVAPGARRAGIGSALLEHATGVARAHGRRVLRGESPAQGPGAAFARAHGFSSGLVEVRRALDLRAADPGRLAELRREAERHAAGYTLERWRGSAPERLLPDLAVLINGMNDAPMGDLDVTGEHWDVERVLAMERMNEAADTLMYATIARHAATGEPAGYSALAVPRSRPDGWARQTDTVVLRPHRGHRLGLLLKLANLAWMREHEPDVEHIVTWNAASNSHMIAINERMGFRVRDEWHQWQRPLDAPAG
ncbi:GNAT superfamily N-acetyltransferase [Thermocatellispora tengchongensis]|uniref:GNAT superfamily N-acetyltransferase n=1 Tax=Thermocatellispora tengchongensis TaxID=1073253 RepID=A0A840P744_9ACTN|nr:GNAT family N-acetyltransferase [Thermocatellispora tengchongensis]MBB5133037.1 GNAT superfamily N-acetyltransferase [Thermocatellispora tengchongensis]